MNAVSETGKHGTEKYFHFVFKWLYYIIPWRAAYYIDASVSFQSPVKHFVDWTVICGGQDRISEKKKNYEANSPKCIYAFRNITWI